MTRYPADESAVALPGEESGDKGGARSLTSAVFLQIRADILACRLPPGEKLHIAALARRLGVSLAAVREALSRLLAEGLVTAQDQRGFRVSLVSLADFEDVTRTRIDIECLALERSILSGDAEWERGIRTIWDVFGPLVREEPVRPDDLWAVLHNRFHLALVAGCGSPWLLRFRTVLYEQSTRYRRLALWHRDVGRDLQAEHFALMEAILSRDVASSKALMEAHLLRTAEVVRFLPETWYAERLAEASAETGAPARLLRAEVARNMRTSPAKLQKPEHGKAADPKSKRKQVRSRTRSGRA